MNLINKFRREIFLFFLISLFYFALRLIFLDRLPIFTDEAIYIRWAQIALHDSSWRFISLTDGKQPMFVWFAMVFLKFISDPLIAGRLVSVFSGFFTMLGIFALTHELFKNRVTSFLSIILYVFYPFAQVYDRMALYDSMVATFAVWTLYFSIVLVKKIRLDSAYTLGFLIGGATLTKTTGFLSIYLLPFTVILYDLKRNPGIKKFTTWIFLAAFASAIGFGLYNILRLSPLFEMIQIKNTLFIYPFSQWLQHPFTFLYGNFSGLSSWLLEYLQIPYIVLILLSLILINKHFKEKVLLVLYFLVPFVGLALFGNVLYPRFIYFMSLFLFAFSCLGLKLYYPGSTKIFGKQK